MLIETQGKEEVSMGVSMFENIAVLGAGTMGHGIAQLFAWHGFNVALYDPNPEALRMAREKISSNVILMQEQGESPGSPKIMESLVLYTSELTEAVSASDLIIETAWENLDIKLKLFRQLAPVIKPQAIIASNTSTFGLETLAQHQPFANRMIITHFFNPAPIVPLVEIVRLSITSQGIIEQVIELLTHCGKVPVLLKRDIPGFIANRLQAAVLREACYLLENGVADAEQIDTAMKEGPGMRWALKGPFEIADLGGLDIWGKVAARLFPLLDTRQEEPDSIRDKVREGKLGLKSGNGFYDYVNESDGSITWSGLDRDLMFLQKLKQGVVVQNSNS